MTHTTSDKFAKQTSPLCTEDTTAEIEACLCEMIDHPIGNM